MSIAQFISYSSQQFVNELWKELGPQTQLFYDRGRDNFLLRNGGQILMVNKSTPTKVTRVRIPYEAQITQMCSYADQSYLAYQTDKQQLNIFCLKLNKQTVYKLPKSDKPTQILHFEFLYSSKGSVDFIIVENNGVRMFKFDDEKSTIKETKFSAGTTSACWFEPKNEILVTSNHANQGVMQTFFFNEKRKDLKYKGPEFDLEDDQKKSKSLSDKLFGRSNNSMNQNQFNPPGDFKNADLTIELLGDHPTRIFVINLYGKSYLLYSQSSTGKIFLFHLHYEKITKQPYVLTYPSDIIVQLSVVDSLIILSAISVRISIVFDIRKTQKPDQPIGPPQPIEEEIMKNVAVSKIPTIDEKKEIEQKDTENAQKQSEEETYNYLGQSVFPQTQNKQEKEQSEVQFGFDFEGLFADIKDSDKERRARDQFVVKMKWTVKPLVSETQLIKENDVLKPSLIYDKNCLYLEDEFVVDPVSKQLYSFQISLTQLPRLLEDEIESFLATLRRSNCKTHVFEFLRELVLKRKQIMIFSLIYKHVFEIFSRALHERNHKTEQNISQDAPSERLSNGYSILYPNDFHVSFFQPLSDDHQRVCRVYLVELLVEYIRQFNDNLRDHRVQVPSQIQNLLIKQLVKDNRMSYVHFLLQYQILGDSVDFAKLLIEISCRETLEQKKLLGKYQVYEPAFQMGIDMLHRLQRYDEMLDIFIKRGRFSEAAHLLRKYPITQKIKLQPVIDGCSRQNPEYSNQEVVAFFEDIQRRTKGEKLAFTVEELKAILQS